MFSVLLCLLNIIFCSYAQVGLPKHCQDVKDSGDSASGVRDVYFNSILPDFAIQVYCEQTTDGGGWTVIQARTTATQKRENFNKNWPEYVQGFGDPSGEFWLGLENMYELTKNADMELRIDLKDYEGQKRFAKYEQFEIGDSSTHYRLNIGKYSGDAGDSFLYGTKNDNLNGMPFSTKDKDNDRWQQHNCAKNSRAGWWYNFCARVNLNGIVLPRYEWQGIIYFTFRGSKYSLENARMMVRPRRPVEESSAVRPINPPEEHPGVQKPFIQRPYNPEGHPGAQVAVRPPPYTES